VLFAIITKRYSVIKIDLSGVFLESVYIIVNHLAIYVHMYSNEPVIGQRSPTIFSNRGCNHSLYISPGLTHTDMQLLVTFNLLLKSESQHQLLS